MTTTDDGARWIQGPPGVAVGTEQHMWSQSGILDPDVLRGGGSRWRWSQRFQIWLVTVPTTPPPSQIINIKLQGTRFKVYGSDEVHRIADLIEH